MDPNIFAKLGTYAPHTRVRRKGFETANQVVKIAIGLAFAKVGQPVPI